MGNSNKQLTGENENEGQGMESHTSISSDSECGYATISSAPPKRRAGRTKFRETRHPIYKGVRRRGEGRWVCEVREPNKKSRIWLGTYATAEMAARAHDVAAIALRGLSACLNFADSAWRLPVPDSDSPAAIRAAAAMAAEAFKEGSDSPNDVGGDGAEKTMAASEVFDLEWGDYMEGYYYENLAQGLLVDPPLLTGLDDADFSADVSLWSHSV